jgi:hypothetical protein
LEKVSQSQQGGGVKNPSQNQFHTRVSIALRLSSIPRL